MEISKGGTALFAMQKAMEQPRQLLDILQKSAQFEQKLPSPPKSDREDDDIAAMTGKGQQVNIVV